MSSTKSSSKSSSSHSEATRKKSHKRSSDEKGRHQTNRKALSNSDRHEDSKEIHLKRESHRTEDSVTGDEPGEDLYRLDDGAEIWRTFDGSVIFWEVHKLTFEEFSQAIWSWAERGLDQIQKSYVASIHPPHGGHQSRLLDFFCSHRQKLIRDHIQRIYSDLYLILRTWTELKHYLRQLNEKSIAQTSSKTVKKIENRLTFHLMVSLREYGGLPLDPKHPDKPSWPSSSEESQKNVSRLKAEALASTSQSMSKSSGSERSSLLNQDTDSKAICSHCHEVLESIPAEKPPADRNKKSFRPPSLSDIPSESSVTCHLSESQSRKEKTSCKNKSDGREEKKSRSEAKPASEAKSASRLGSSRSQPKTCGKSNNEKRSKSKNKSSDDSDNMSLISFDSNQFSNTFGTMFKLL